MSDGVGVVVETREAFAGARNRQLACAAADPAALSPMQLTQGRFTTI